MPADLPITDADVAAVEPAMEEPAMEMEVMPADMGADVMAVEELFDDESNIPFCLV